MDLCNYNDFDSLCMLSLKVESQNKSCYSDGSSNNWSKGSSASGYGTQTKSGGTVRTKPATNQNKPSEPVQNKTSVAPKETSLSKVRCFKCQGFGHFARACPNNRVVTLREAMSLRDEIMEEEEELSGIFNFDEPEPIENSERVESKVEEHVTPKYDTLVVRTLQAKPMPLNGDQRDQIFHTKCQVNDKWCSVIIDGGSCTNVASNEMVSKLNLHTMCIQDLMLCTG